jgi:hypothetical protein
MTFGNKVRVYINTQNYNYLINLNKTLIATLPKFKPL